MAAPSLVGLVSGLTVARWGTDGAGTISYGIVVALRHGKNSDKNEVKGPDGDTIAQLFYNRVDDLELEVLAYDAAAQPDNGDEVTVHAIAALVQDSEENWRIGQWSSMRIRLKKFENLATS